MRRVYITNNGGRLSLRGPPAPEHYLKVGTYADVVYGPYKHDWDILAFGEDRIGHKMRQFVGVQSYVPADAGMED